MDVELLPYRAEYAKSGRAGCRGCKTSIAKDTLRLAVYVQSPMFDGRSQMWYHQACFFKKQRPNSTDDIEHFESLRWDDQEKIRNQIASPAIIVPEPKGKGKKRSAGDSAAKKNALKDFRIETAKSGRAMCRGCEQKILKDEVRIAKKDFQTDIGKKYGGQDMWHHVQCFAKLRAELGYFESADKLPGFAGLSKDEQADAKKHIPAIKQEEVPLKKLKTEDEVDGKTSNSTASSELDKKIKENSKVMFKYRDWLKDNLSKVQVQELIEENNQSVPPGLEPSLDKLCDIMTFGCLKECSKCSSNYMKFTKQGYVCHGDLSEWTKCMTVYKEPERRPFVIPDNYKEEFKFLLKYKYVPRIRVFKEVAPSAVKKEDDVTDGPKVKRELPALHEMEFFILGKLKRGKDVAKKEIQKLGGKVAKNISSHVLAVISNEKEVEELDYRMEKAKDLKIHVVSEDFLDAAQKNAGKITDLVLKKSICDWGSDPTKRLPDPSKSMKSKSKSIYEKSGPSTVKLTVKGGTAVDPDSGLQDCAYVYQENKVKWTSVLGLTDLQRSINKYYKLQLLRGDSSNQFYVFRSWGRIGTTIGGNKVDNFHSLHEAKNFFEHHYEEKSGNTWGMRDCFEKMPGKMYPIDVDYGDDDNIKLNTDSSVPSKLKLPVQELMKLIFDINNMKQLMMEFELDTEKMPLGKLSKSQITKAMGVLIELSALAETNQPDHSRLIDANNRFYTLIPHSFGVNDPPLITDIEAIKKKTEMLESLLELEIAYNLMKTTGNDGNSIDAHYEKLNTEIDTLDPGSVEFGIIQEYVRNTHAATHSSYTLDVVEVFVVKRQGEAKRFKPFKKLHNRKLLWHGSRTTNYAGILSQGLRIAPPEAPVTGYMFGKGVYFADMVSKSANYCCTTPTNPTGLLLLCDVALGDMHELTNAEMIVKPPTGKHSVKGVGMTEPDPNLVKTIEENIHVPLGKGVKKTANSTSLLYNEYIVYDVAQVNIKYLLRVKFNHKY